MVPNRHPGGICAEHSDCWTASSLAPGCLAQQRAVRLTTWLKLETKDMFVLCHKCVVSFWP